MLAHARAQRDLACTYTLGFYVEENEIDRVRNVTVQAKRPGLRVLHPGKYVFRSPEAKRESLLLAAWIAPTMFQTGVVRAHVFPLRPTSSASWQATLAVAFAVPLAGAEGEPVTRDFGAVLSRDATIVHKFSRSITLQPDNAGVVSEPLVTFLDDVDLKAGRYTLTAVVSDVASDEPHAASVEVIVPEIPNKELFLVGPMLGRHAGADVVVEGSSGEERVAPENSFAPLLVHRLEAPGDVLALSQVCWVGGKKVPRKQIRDEAVVRSLLTSDGKLVGTLPDVELALEGEDAIACQNLLDVIPGDRLPEGSFRFEAAFRGAATDAPAAVVRFEIAPR